VSIRAGAGQPKVSPLEPDQQREAVELGTKLEEELVRMTVAGRLFETNILRGEPTGP
jgi:hypothetical protein